MLGHIEQNLPFFFSENLYFSPPTLPGRCGIARLNPRRRLLVQSSTCILRSILNVVGSILDVVHPIDGNVMGTLLIKKKKEHKKPRQNFERVRGKQIFFLIFSRLHATPEATFLVRRSVRRCFCSKFRSAMRRYGCEDVTSMGLSFFHVLSSQWTR